MGGNIVKAILKDLEPVEMIGEMRTEGYGRMIRISIPDVAIVGA
ncbi:MAG: hypothetical protein ABIG67_06250 [Pseudomonadota bacterium]